MRIRNPIGGPGWTSAKSAIKMLKRGTARLVGENEIEIIASDFRAQSAERSMIATPEEPSGSSPTHSPALLVAIAEPLTESLRTFAPYPYRWEGYQAA